MRKKNRYLKALSILLVLCVLSQSMPAYARDSGRPIISGTGSSGATNETSGNQPTGNDSAASRSSTTQAGKPSLSEAKVGGAGRRCSLQRCHRLRQRQLCVLPNRSGETGQ